MAEALERKKVLVRELNAVASEALSAVMVDYRGVAVAELTDLRVKSRAAGVQVRVVRNTLARRAFQGTEHECLSELLSGPTLVGFSLEEPGAVARIFRDFAREHELFEVKALSLGGKLLPPEQLEQLAKLPTREEALARLLGLMKAPVGGLARSLKDIPGRLVRAVSAVGASRRESD